MNERGTYGAGFVRTSGSPRASVVGISLFHTVGDRDRLVSQIDTEFGQLISELYRKMGGDPNVFVQSEILRDPIGWSQRYQAAAAIIKRSPLYPLWEDTAMPVWSEWRKFYKDQSTWEEWKTNWDVYENWHDRVAKLHEHVSAEVQRITGDRIRTPSPTPAPTTVWADLEHGAEGAVGGALTVVKYGAIAALGVAAFVLLTKSR